MTRPTIERPAVGDLFRPEGVRVQPSPREPRILLLLHEGCGRCRRWVRQELATVGDDLEKWAGRIVRLESGFQAPDPEAAWIAVTDEWDEVFHVAHVGPDHVFPEPADLVDWVRFVAIQCPECEGPEGPWRR